MVCRVLVRILFQNLSLEVVVYLPIFYQFFLPIFTIVLLFVFVFNNFVAED